MSDQIPIPDSSGSQPELYLCSADDGSPQSRAVLIAAVGLRELVMPDLTPHDLSHELDEKATADIVIHGTIVVERESPLALSTARLAISGDEAKLGGVATNESERKRGYGGVVIRALEEHARLRGVEEIRVFSSTNAVNFYVGLGFRRKRPDGIELIKYLE